MAEKQPFSLIDKLPHSIELEKKLLGELLGSGEKFILVSESLTSHDFCLANHQRLYYFLQQIHLKYRTLSESIVLDYLTSNNELENIGGPSYFVELTEQILVSEPIEVCAKIIKAKARRRKLIEKSVELIGKCKEDTPSTDEDVDKILFDVQRINSVIGDEVYKPFGVTCRQTIVDLMEKPQHGIKTGYTELDATLGGLYKKQLSVLAAETSMGKTALALNMFCNISQAGHKCAYLTLEMTEAEIAIRAIQIITKFSFNKIREMNMGTDDFITLSNAIDHYDKMTSLISDKNMQISDIKKTTRKLKQEHGVEVLFIDHLHFIKNNRISENRALEISHYTSELKVLAKELDISIVLLSQINRSSAKQMDRRPELTDLKDSGSIEQDADNVMFIYREWIHNKEANPNVAEIIVNKNRNGERNKTINLHFDGGSMSFTDFAPSNNYKDSYRYGQD